MHHNSDLGDGRPAAATGVGCGEPAQIVFSISNFRKGLYIIFRTGLCIIFHVGLGIILRIELCIIFPIELIIILLL